MENGTSSSKENEKGAEKSSEAVDEAQDVVVPTDATDDNDRNDEKNKNESLNIDTMAANVNVEITSSNSLILSPAESTDGLEDDEPTAASDLTLPHRRIWIITTAGLPWRTGTAVNPLLRALTLCQTHEHVTLVIPWLADASQRQKLYGQNVFETPQDQEEWIREYCRTRCQALEEEKRLQIRFWAGTYNQAFGSIFPTEDICSAIPKEEADVAILEEPEHLTWFRGINSDTSEEDVLGWTHKFNHVVGILHTNYGAYIKQYGVGTAFVTARALNALSALVIKSYCHVVIRLSPTLPLLVDPLMDKVCNVHGVSGVFLDTDASTKENDNKEEEEETTQDEEIAPVYFVGKIIWAKGFDKVLEVQERYRSLTGDYFPIDIYGGGDDLKAVQLAFHGRRNNNAGTTSSSTLGSTGSTLEQDDTNSNSAAIVLSNPDSIREQLSGEFSESVHTAHSAVSNNNSVDLQPPPAADVLGQLTEKMMQSGTETAEASLKLVESVIDHGLGVISGNKSKVEATESKADDNSEEEQNPDDGEKSAKSNLSPSRQPLHTLSFLPARSRFKWRKHPIPARFLGVKDHAEVRKVARQRIFLNMSTTEVLCTTSAEALAMSKFVILPDHPSNQFFLQFPNTLAYSTLDECVEKLQFALENEPKPLSEENRMALSWKGATDRLYDAAIITKRQAKERKLKLNEEQEKAAKTHVEMSRRSHFVGDLFSGKALKKLSSASSTVSSCSGASSPESPKEEAVSSTT